MTESISDIEDLFSKKSFWQCWLDIEAALAQVQAEMRIIPEDAAKAITEKADLDHIDANALAMDIKRTKAPIVSLTRMLAAACDGEYGEYVHWGATTQNIIQTGRILQVRKVYNLMQSRMGMVLTAMVDLAERGSEMIMAGRTQRRHALPITFGFKVAGWIDEILRHLDRFNEVESRFFCLQFGGAIGAMQSFGEHGPELNRRLAKRLALYPLKVPVRSSNDYLAEYVSTMTLYATTCSKIAQELYTLMSDEIGEVIEGQGAEVVGSSTMPQKVNSKIASNVITVAAHVRSQLWLALEGMQPSHEGDAASNSMMGEAVDKTCIATYELTDDMERLLSSLKLNPERMMENLKRSNGLIATENAMMTLAPIIGRQKAHDIIHEAAQKAVSENQDIFNILMAESVVRENVSPEALRQALDPINYTGHCTEITKDCIARARVIAEKLNSES
jgi:3-carboxy-cis,cis-muconate cycloisomerase